MKRYFRFRNDPKRFKPLVTSDMGLHSRYWGVTVTSFDEQHRIYITDSFAKAIEQANCWADEYRAAWVAANMKAA